MPGRGEVSPTSSGLSAYGDQAREGRAVSQCGRGKQGTGGLAVTNDKHRAKRFPTRYQLPGQWCRRR
jgi:hypothetical protein